MSFYGRSNRESIPRTARSTPTQLRSSNFSGNTPPTPQQRVDTYGPGMYLEDHPSSSSHASDEEFSFDTPRSNSGKGYTNSSHGSSFYMLNTPSSDRRRISPTGREISQNTTPTGPRTAGRETFHRRNPDFDLQAMIQQQQATLETILTNQKSIQTKQSQMEVKLRDLEAKFNTPQPALSSPPKSGKRKQTVTHEISVSDVLHDMATPL